MYKRSLAAMKKLELKRANSEFRIATDDNGFLWIASQQMAVSTFPERYMTENGKAIIELLLGLSDKQRHYYKGPVQFSALGRYMQNLIPVTIAPIELTISEERWRVLLAENSLIYTVKTSLMDAAAADDKNGVIKWMVQPETSHTPQPAIIGLGPGEIPIRLVVPGRLKVQTRDQLVNDLREVASRLETSD